MCSIPPLHLDSLNRRRSGPTLSSPRSASASPPRRSVVRTSRLPSSSERCSSRFSTEFNRDAAVAKKKSEAVAATFRSISFSYGLQGLSGDYTPRRSIQLSPKRTLNSSSASASRGRAATGDAAASPVTARRRTATAEPSKRNFDNEGCAVHDIAAGKLISIERPSLYSDIAELQEVLSSSDYKKTSECQISSPASVTSMDPLPLLDYAWFGKLAKRCRDGYRERVQDMCSRLLTYAEHDVHLYELEGAVEFNKSLAAVCQHYRFELKTQVGPMSALLSANDLATIMWLRRVAVCSPSGKTLAYALFGKSLFRVRHSCAPNCRLFVDPTTTKGYLIAVRAIQVHEPLTISYVDVRQPHSQRIRSMMRFRGLLRCRCDRCENCGCRGDDDPCAECALIDARTQDTLRCGSSRVPDDVGADQFPQLSNAPNEQVLMERLQGYADSPSRKHVDQLLTLSASHGNTCRCRRCLATHLALANCYCMHRKKVLALKHYGIVQKILRSEDSLYYEPELQCIKSNIEAITTESRSLQMYCGWEPYMNYLEERFQVRTRASSMCLSPFAATAITASGSDPNLSRGGSKSYRLPPKRHSGPRAAHQKKQYAITERRH